MKDLIETIRSAVITQTIDGVPVATAYEDVINPVTGAAFQRSPIASQDELALAVASARRAQPAWAALGWDEREACLNRLGDAIEANIDYLAALQVMEQGMILPVSHWMMGYVVRTLRLLSSVRVPDRLLLETETNVVSESWRPLGVVAAIAPWNAPVILGIEKVVTALIGGNTVVLKPSELTPLSTLEVGRIARDVLPAGVCNVISGGREVGTALVAHPGVDKVSFTGSTATGIHIARESSGHLRPVTLELGGNDAAILLPDGSIPDLVASIMMTGLADRGQFCAAIKRVYVPTALHDQLCDALVEAVGKVRIGDGLDPDIHMGPIQNKAQFDKICGYVDDARAAGGKILTGGAPLDREGYFYPPTVITGLADGVRVVDEEQFGPIMPVIGYDDLDAVIDAINAGPYGLTGSVWTADLARGAEVAARLDVGTGWVNHHGNFDQRVPFPLIKASGMGMDWADYGVKGAMRMQVINVRKAD